MLTRFLRHAAPLALAACFLTPSAPLPAQERAQDPTRSLSPYFVVDKAEAGIDALPLKATRVDVKINGVIADVRVTQVYRNEGSTPLEARYVFPASTRAAVYGMRMRIGERAVDAEISEKQAARRDYETAKMYVDMGVARLGVGYTSTPVICGKKVQQNSEQY
jgi:Ca-activated chloride channel family protein